ncbi:methyltransferase [Streptomyces antarcticus]|uniref:methyltransferase n=1 Tax=Streptomyces antarcticus TaxID=2996458 RepID=UPI00226FA89E|nr:methyltransferase [Streptomyces sp. H34-AA3]MCY0946248.1 methyltransferase [Streptomyces sp. H34-AA3]
MSLTREEQALHREARELVKLRRPLTETERDIVLGNWQESSTATNALDGAHFTPTRLAWDMRLEVGGRRVIDLCAGIGRLADAARDKWVRQWDGAEPREIVCVERNPEYVAVGMRVLPDVRWVCADILTMDPKALGLNGFDYAVANPPYGPRVQRAGSGPRYRGSRFEFHAIDVASTVARAGVFLIPQASAPFEYSGARYYQERHSGEYARFHRETGLTLTAGIGIDTSAYQDEWRGVSPRVEVVRADFEDMGTARSPVSDENMV